MTVSRRQRLIIECQKLLIDLLLEMIERLLRKDNLPVKTLTNADKSDRISTYKNTDSDDVDWITTKTKVRVPVNEGQTPTEACNEFFGEKERESGGASGALNRESREARKHAESYYKQIRNRKAEPEIEVISKNTGIPKEQIADIRNHLFNDKIKFRDGRVEQFYPDYEQSQAWQRLLEGKHTDNDILLLKHEYTELTYMREHNSVYEDAHEYANQYFNWQKTLN